MLHQHIQQVLRSMKEKRWGVTWEAGNWTEAEGDSKGQGPSVKTTLHGPGSEGLEGLERGEARAGPQSHQPWFGLEQGQGGGMCARTAVVRHWGQGCGHCGQAHCQAVDVTGTLQVKKGSELELQLLWDKVRPDSWAGLG